MSPHFLQGSALGVSPQNNKFDKDMLMFTVKDTGVGITENQKNELFKPFAQVQPFQTQGSGLGLYIVAQKALKLGGTFGLIDNPQHEKKGSTFFLQRAIHP